MGIAASARLRWNVRENDVKDRLWDGYADKNHVISRGWEKKTHLSQNQPASHFTVLQRAAWVQLSHV